MSAPRKSELACTITADRDAGRLSNSTYRTGAASPTAQRSQTSLRSSGCGLSAWGRTPLTKAGHDVDPAARVELSLSHLRQRAIKQV
jgi:hypothetical protein